MIRDVIQKTKARMEKAVEDLRRELSGRAIGPGVDFTARPYHSGVLRRADSVEPGGDAVGSRANLITAQPWDVSLLPAIEKAIRVVRLGPEPWKRRQVDSDSNSSPDGRAPETTRRSM